MGYFFNLLKNIDKVLLVIPLLFALLSVTILASITYTGDSILNREIIVQIIAYCIGFGGMIIMLLIDYQTYGRYEKAIYIISVLFLLLVYTPLGIENYGSRAWIDLGVTEMQPSELVKISFVLIFAHYLSRHKEDLDTLQGVLMSVLYAAPFLLIIIKEDLGSGLVVFASYVGMVFYAGINGKIFGRTAAVGLVSIPILYRFMAGYQKDRIDAFLHPENTSIQAAYHVWQSKVAIGSGGWFGKGLFSGTQKELNFLPVQKSDFIFAVIVEELGLIGGAVLIGLFALFLNRIWRIAAGAKDLCGSLIAIGILSMFAFQIFENIAMTMGLMPVTGITLPFISAGGTAIMSNMIALGVVLGVGIRSKIINF